MLCSPSYEIPKQNYTSGAIHHVQLLDLAPLTTYFYKVSEVPCATCMLGNMPMHAAG